ncbi:MAG: hypothetical protein A2698_01595 [Candidatus Levybacteria bacterium RIFCSPHIGHO2_01_FULL_42_15]|nr:MAG: hypothetical protein A2698_01595 [Candidatus Levybacteria bacterium RIFCSPHIGHO2_01_FULL_42_15]OGH42509.1 MAG: hypothetical protein A3B53_03385 [Candidatus Levybacteria bacterium RIFCSPLOWO2_01_FULL_42_15]
MAENKKTADSQDVKQPGTGAMHHVPQATDNTIVLHIPKPNMQVVILGLVAFITLFQTFQLVRISANSATAPVKTAPTAATTTNTGSGTDVPQSMVGGC